MANGNKQIEEIKKDIEKREKDRILLNRLKKIANRKKISTGKKVVIILLSLFAIGACVAIPVINYIKDINKFYEITIEMKGVPSSAYIYKTKESVTVGALTPKEIKGYVFEGFFSDEECLIKLESTDVINQKATIYCKYNQTSYNITLPSTQIGYIVSATKNTVGHGDDFTFSVALNEAYTNSNFKVKANNQTLTASSSNGNIYNFTVENIKFDIEINVTNVTKNVYVISHPTENEMYTINSISSQYVEHGSSYEFNVELKAGYSNSNIIVMADGQIVVKENSKYTISNISKDISISVDGLEINTYSISLQPYSTGISRVELSTNNVQHGGSFKLIIELKPEYNNSIPIVRPNYGAGITPTYRDGNVIEFIINNITEAQLIFIEGIVQNS